jgi:hypothetical protein
MPPQPAHDINGWDPTALGIAAIIEGTLACQDPNNADALLDSMCAAGEQLVAEAGSPVPIPFTASRPSLFRI